MERSIALYDIIINDPSKRKIIYLAKNKTIYKECKQECGNISKYAENNCRKMSGLLLSGAAGQAVAIKSKRPLGCLKIK